MVKNVQRHVRAADGQRNGKHDDKRIDKTFELCGKDQIDEESQEKEPNKDLVYEA